MVEATIDATYATSRPPNAGLPTAGSATHPRPLRSVAFWLKAQVDNRTVPSCDDWRHFIAGQLAGE